MRRATLRCAIASATAGAAVLSGASALAAPPAPPPTADFVDAAAQSDSFERLEAETALTQSRDPRVRAFAQHMIDAHAATTAALQQATARAGLAPPLEGLSGDQAMLLSALQGQSGADFDRTYARHQVLGHTQAAVVEQGYADGGPDGPVRDAARAALPVIRDHLAEAQQLNAALGGS